MKNIKRVIDDTLLYATNLKEAFKQALEYLMLVGRNGIVLNPEKFAFRKDEVDWAGVRITKSGVKPLLEHVDAIRNIPVPENITDSILASLQLAPISLR